MPTMTMSTTAVATIAILPTIMVVSLIFFSVLSASNLGWLKKLFWSRDKKEFYKNDAINGSRFPKLGDYPGRESDLAVTWERELRIKKYRRENPEIGSLPNSWVEELIEKND